MMLRRLMIAGSGATGEDPYFADVISLLRMEGADGSTTFIDRAPIPRPTWVAEFGAKITDADPPPGQASSLRLLGGNAGLYGYDNSALNTGPFTVEAVIKLDSISTCATVLDKRASGLVNGILFGIYSARQLGLEVRPSSGTGPAGAIQSPNNVVPLNQWVHVAVTRSGNVYRFFVAGTKVHEIETTGYTYNFPSTAGIVGRVVDGNSAYSLVGKIAAIRVTRVCRYTGNFTPPALPWPIS